MRLKNVRLIFLREVRDQLRDRRTLFMIAILPLLLYPGLGIGMFRMMTVFEEQPRVVVILGADQLPADPPLVEGDRFAARWFLAPFEVDEGENVGAPQLSDADMRVAEARAKTLIVETDRVAQHPKDSDRSPETIAQATRIRTLHQEWAQLEAALAQADKTGKSSEVERVSQQLDAVKRRLGEEFGASEFQVLVLIPEGFADSLDRESRAALDRRGAGRSGKSTRTTVIHNNADRKSQVAHKRVEEVLDAWEREILRVRLQAANLPEDFSKPVNRESVDLAQKAEISNSVWSMVFPGLLVIMAVTGAFYPAVDLAAGEKERGTMETLLICPATRSEIVIGKFLTVLLFSVTTALLNMMSMGLTGKFISSIGGGALARVGSLDFPPVLALFWVGVLLVPLATLFSALCLALATFARSSKEGQYYLTPLLTVTMGLTVFCMSPAIEITPFYSVMPIAGPALLLKALIADPHSAEPLSFAFPVLASSFVYSVLALWWAIELFAREDVLFREAERLDLGLWLKHVLRDKESTPSFSEAGLYFVVVMLLQFFAIKPLVGAIDPNTTTERMLQIQMIYLVATIGAPALLMGVMLAGNFRKTFRLYWPSWKMLAAAAALPFVLHPLSIELLRLLEGRFLPAPNEEMRKLLQSMSDQAVPLGIVLLAFAVTPAVCEELAFRGFMLSGFGRSRRMWLAIVLSSIAFGIAHPVSQQAFNATLLGLVLGLIAIRANSLLPAILFHLLYNALQIVVSRLDFDAVQNSPVAWLFKFEQIGGEPVVTYGWPTLLLAGAIAAAILIWLVKQRREPESTGVRESHGIPAQSETHPSRAPKPPVSVG